MSSTNRIGSSDDHANGLTSGAAKSQKMGSSASGEFQNLVSDVEDIVKDTAALTGEDIARAKEKLGERISAAKKTLEEMGGTVVDQARKTAKATDTYVHDEPWKAVGIGAMVGLLLGFALSRR